MEMRKQIMLQYQFCFVIGLIFITAQLPAIIAQSSGSSSSESLPCLPCTYRGTIIPHGEYLIVDECVTCTCDNTTVKCDHKSCPGLFCHEPLSIENECCDVCPYHVPIYEVNARDLSINTKRKVNNIIFDLNLMISGEAGSVAGEGLWKLGVWGSCNADGEGERISYKEQVLTGEQASTDLIRRPIWGGFEFNIRNIAVSLDRAGRRCSDMEFLCFEFNKGDNPDPEHTWLPFTVEGVAGEDDMTPAPENLKRCISRYMAERPEHCSYIGNHFRHGEIVKIVDECTTVHCNNGTVQEDIESCPPLICDSPVKFDGECCKRCTYYLPIYEVNVGTLDDITERMVNDIVLNLNLNINSAATSVTGHGLWKLSIWSSSNADGDGQRISYQEQVLTEGQAATNLIRQGSFYRGSEFNIRNIIYALNATGATCSEMEFLCYEFNKGDNPDPYDPRLDFTVEGVAGEHDLTPAPQNLRGCTRVSKCIKALTIHETNACLIKGAVVDARASNPYKINYNMIMGDGLTVKEQGLWKLTAYGSASADGTGEKLNPTIETLDARQASMKFTPGQFVYFGKVDFYINMHEQTCDTVQYICVELGVASGHTDHFTVIGLKENALRSCVHAFCKGKSVSKKNLAARSRN